MTVQSPLFKTHPVQAVPGLGAAVVVRCGYSIETGLTEHTPVIVPVHHLSDVPCIVTLEMHAVALLKLTFSSIPGRLRMKVNPVDYTMYTRYTCNYI